MTPVSNTIFSVALFLALASLSHWMERRQRTPRMVRRAIDLLGKDQRSI